MPRLQSPLPSLQKPAFDKRSSPALSAGLGALSPKLGGWEGESLRTETVTADAGIPRAGSLAQARGARELPGGTRAPCCWPGIPFPSAPRRIWGSWEMWPVVSIEIPALGWGGRELSAGDLGFKVLPVSFRAWKCLTFSATPAIRSVSSAVAGASAARSPR